MKKKSKKEKQIVSYEWKETPYTSESIIKRLIDEKHINGEEAMILIKELYQQNRRLTIPYMPRPIEPYYEDKYCIYNNGRCSFSGGNCEFCPKRLISVTYTGDSAK